MKRLRKTNSTNTWKLMKNGRLAALAPLSGAQSTASEKPHIALSYGRSFTQSSGPRAMSCANPLKFSPVASDGASSAVSIERARGVDRAVVADLGEELHADAAYTAAAEPPTLAAECVTSSVSKSRRMPA